MTHLIALALVTLPAPARAANDQDAGILAELQRTLETDAAATAARERVAIEAQILDQAARRASNDQLPAEDEN